MRNLSVGYWEDFYKDGSAPTQPSPFAIFVDEFFKRNFPEVHRTKIVDIGCGNGRDSYYFGRRGWSVLGIDPAVYPVGVGKTKFLPVTVESALPKLERKNIVTYSRFFLHSIPDETVADVINNSSTFFAAEARAVGDIPLLFPGHYRNPVNPEKLLSLLQQANYRLLYFEIGRGLAIYKKEDPLIVRVIGKKR